MRIVRQRYVGWIGVLDEETRTVDNGAIEFALTQLREEQLDDCDPTYKELKQLEQRMVDSNSPGLSFVRRLLHGKSH